MQSRWILLFVSISFVLGHAKVWADTSTAASELVTILENTKTLQAHFHQKIRDTHDHSVSKSQGQMLVKKPNQFLWKSTTPDPMQVIADGKVLWTYDVDLAQVTKQPLEEALQNSPATFLAGEASELKKHYHVTFAKTGECQKGIDRCFELRPVQSDSPFSSVILGFTQNKLAEMRMRDTLGQNVHIVFTQVKINEPLNQALFSFKPPKGVDVLSPQKSD